MNLHTQKTLKNMIRCFITLGNLLFLTGIISVTLRSFDTTLREEGKHEFAYLFKFMPPLLFMSSFSLKAALFTVPKINNFYSIAV